MSKTSSKFFTRRKAFNPACKTLQRFFQQSQKGFRFKLWYWTGTICLCVTTKVAVWGEISRCKLKYTLYVCLGHVFKCWFFVYLSNDLTKKKRWWLFFLFVGQSPPLFLSCSSFWLFFFLFGSVLLLHDVQK